MKKGKKLKLFMFTSKLIFFLIYVSTLVVNCRVIPRNNKVVDNFILPTNKHISVEDGLTKNNIAKDEKYIQNIIEDKNLYNHGASKHFDSTSVNEPISTPLLNTKDKDKIVTTNSTYGVDIIDTNNPKEKIKESVESVHNDSKENPEIPKDNSPEIKQPPIEKDLPNKDEITVLCKDAWFDESKPCDHIPDNLKPTDELGRSVPHFFTSQEAWNWGELQVEDENSKYGCRGFSRMDGYQNDGTQFFFAYLKVCDSN